MKINARAIDSVSFVFAKWLIFSVDLLSKDAAPKGRRIFSGPYLHWHAGGRRAVGGGPQLHEIFPTVFSLAVRDFSHSL